MTKEQTPSAPPITELERSGFVSRVNLDGLDGCAEVDVRVRLPIEEARRLSPLMLEGSVVRVCFPKRFL